MKSRYWTVERLYGLIDVLIELAKRDDEGLYFVPGKLHEAAAHVLSQKGPKVSASTAMAGLRMLVFFGVLDPAKITGRSKSHKRRFHPYAISEITAEGLVRYRESLVE